MSTCVGGGRTYSFDLDVVKKPSSSSSSRSSSPSSTLFESSHSPLAISIKRARTPRKRPSQTYNEAAALLSAIHPSIFTTKTSKQFSKNTKRFFPFPESSDVLLPSLPVLSDAAFLIHHPQSEKPPAAAIRVQLKHKIAVDKDCSSPASNISSEPNFPDLPFDDEFDAESILEEGAEQGIDSIICNLAVDAPTTDDNHSEEGLGSCNPSLNPLLRSIIGCRFELSFGLRNLHQALRKRDESDWWLSPAMPMRDITPTYKPSTAMPPLKKKNNKKTKNAVSTSEQVKLKACGLGLKLNHEDLLKAWSDQRSMFSNELDSLNSSGDPLARLAHIDLFSESTVADDVRAASVLRYKDKHRTRLLSKKIRYQVPKMNAARRLRTKANGKFDKNPSIGEEENQ